MNKIKYLILEDASSDRLRFSQIFAGLKLRQVMDIGWRLDSHGEGSVLEWFLNECKLEFSPVFDNNNEKMDRMRGQEISNRIGNIITILNKYKVVLLDLAWSVEAERTIRPSLYKDYEELRKEDSLLELENYIEGLAILGAIKKLNPREKTKIPEIWVASAYVPRKGVGLPLLLEKHYGVRGGNIFHKWRDEEPFKKNILEKL